MEHKTFLHLNQQLHTFISAFKQLEKKQHKSSIDDTLNISEIHVISNIGQYQPITPTQLADIREVSRSAITQVLSKLESKGCVEKRYEMTKSHSFHLYLTDKGEKIFQEHEKQQDYIESQLKDCLSIYSDKELERFSTLLNDIQTIWDNLPW